MLPNFRFCTYITYIGVETIIENLSQQLESPSHSESGAKSEDAAAVKLASLRKQVLVQMMSQLDKAEEAGGMRNICFFQVIIMHGLRPYLHVCMCNTYTLYFSRGTVFVLHS